MKCSLKKKKKIQIKVLGLVYITLESLSFVSGCVKDQLAEQLFTNDMM